MVAFVIRHPWSRLLVAVLLAFFALNLYATHKISTEHYALGASTVAHLDMWGTTIFTAPSVETIAAVVRERRAALASGSTTEREYILWLGNSQLHAINQYRPGDHTAPYWLKTALKAPSDLWPLGFSLPNANLQEHQVVSQYVASHLPVRALVLELVFDDLREDGLRAGLSQLVMAPSSLAAGPAETASAPAAPTGPGTEPAIEAKDDPGASALQGFAQQTLEAQLNHRLEKAWLLWSERPDLRARLMTNLYELRNLVFGIKATSIRKIIKPRYERNMRALETMLADYRQRGIPMVLYVAPIRNDVPLPYETEEYESWKNSIQQIAQKYSATLLNLEKSVPTQYWAGSPNGEIDFMHFQGPGHRLVAEALVPYLGKIVVGRSP